VEIIDWPEVLPVLGSLISISFVYLYSFVCGGGRGWDVRRRGDKEW